MNTPKTELPWKPSKDEMRALVQRGIERGLLSVRPDATCPTHPKLYAPDKRVRKPEPLQEEP